MRNLRIIPTFPDSDCRGFYFLLQHGKYNQHSHQLKELLRCALIALDLWLWSIFWITWYVLFSSTWISCSWCILKLPPPPALSVLHRIGFAYGKYPPRSQAAPSAGEASWKAQVVNVVKGGDLVEGKGVSFFFRRGLVYIHTEWHMKLLKTVEKTKVFLKVFLRHPGE